MPPWSILGRSLGLQPAQPAAAKLTVRGMRGSGEGGAASKQRTLATRGWGPAEGSPRSQDRFLQEVSFEPGLEKAVGGGGGGKRKDLDVQDAGITTKWPLRVFGGGDFCCHHTILLR